jgi:hypothetical protein
MSGEYEGSAVAFNDAMRVCQVIGVAMRIELG